MCMTLDFSILFKEIGGIIGFIMVGVLGYLVPIISKRIKSIIQQRFFQMSLKNSIELKIKMAEVRAKFDADRIYLYQFHNGKIFVGDLNFHKYSVSAIFELVESGLSYEIKNHQNMPLDIFEDLLYFMFEKYKDAVIVSDIEGADLHFRNLRSLYDMSVQMRGRTMVALKVKNKIGAFVGLLVMWFPEEMTREQFINYCNKHTELTNLINEIHNKL
jgi:hypothetical protein